MAKKDFKNTSAVNKFISSKDVQDTQDTQEGQNVQHALNTQDAHVITTRKKHPRINMAFYGENHEYLEYISRINGVSITQYVNNLIDRDRAINQDKVDKAKEILNG